MTCMIELEKHQAQRLTKIAWLPTFTNFYDELHSCLTRPLLISSLLYLCLDTIHIESSNGRIRNLEMREYTQNVIYVFPSVRRRSQVIFAYLNFVELFRISRSFTRLVWDRRRWRFHISLTDRSSRLQRRKLNKFETVLPWDPVKIMLYCSSVTIAENLN